MKHEKTTMVMNLTGIPVVFMQWTSSSHVRITEEGITHGCLVAALVRPSCRHDPVARERLWEDGTGECEVIRNGERRFPEHCQPPLQPKLILMNAWKERMEGGYLLPDMIHGLGYMEAVKKFS